MQNTGVKILLALLMCMLENEMSRNARSRFVAPSSSAELLTVRAGNGFKSDSKLQIFHEKFLLESEF